jgi:transcription termination/antitermination protein NusG
LSQLLTYTNSDMALLGYPLSGPSWYAVHVRSNFEKRVATELTAKGLESYLPAVSETHAWKDRKKVIEVPLFPGYVFTRFSDTGVSRLAVLRTTGAVRILGSRDTIEVIPDSEVEAIQTLLQAKVPLLAHPLLREGARVRIRRGPLKDVEGLLVRIKSEARLVLSVELLCRSVSTEVDVSDVEVLRATSISPGRLTGWSTQTT